MAAGGINIEDPCLFTYGGRWYYFTAIISNPDKSVGHQALDNKHLELFEYTNEINSLCIYGNVIYFDVDGSISRFINRMDNHLVVTCQQMRKVSDGGNNKTSPMEMFVPYGRANGQDTFTHTFIVQNIGILDRDKQNITYQISLVSTNWYQLCTEISFSNYAAYYAGIESKETPTNGFRMLKTFLSNALKPKPGVTVDESSFDTCASNSKTKIPLITNGNDNVFTLVPYIFDKLYYHKSQIEESLKFIVYDVITNTYRCIDYVKDSSWLPCTKPNIILSMFETDYEQELFSVNNNLAMVVGKPQTQTYENLFTHIMWTYNSIQNSFDRSETTLETKDIAALYNKVPKMFELSGDAKIQPKYSLEMNSEWFKGTTMHHQSSLWNNDYSIYQNMLDNLMKRDALIVNTEGDITHQPGTYMGIVLDRTIEKVPEMTPEQKKELYEKHRQIEGLFPVLKVQHRYHLSNRKDVPASYTENVVLGRNFILPPGKNE